MVDYFDFPRIIGNTPDEKISELTHYLIQFKEALEFALTNITAENLSPELLNKLNALGADIEKSNADRESEIAQISNFNSITVSDVCNSEIFKNEIENKIMALKFNVNFDTGYLEYDISNKEVNNGL